MIASNLAIAAALLGAPAAPDAEVRVETGGTLSSPARRVTIVHVDTASQQVTKVVEGTPTADEADVASAPEPVAPVQEEPAAESQPRTEAVQEEQSETPQGDSNLDGDIIVTGEFEAPQGDPAEQLNAATYEVVEAIDLALVEPIAEAYDEGVPKPVRSGIRNFLRNLGEPINFLNFLLQLKPGKALKTVGRFAINTTVGIGGLFNPAEKQFGLKYEHNGLANTLGFYGIGPGPYLYLPFIGSTTVRDLAGQIVDLSIIPTVAGKPFNQPIYTIPVATLNGLESRIETDDQIDAIRQRCNDGYSANRDIYLIQRQLEIDELRGKRSDNLNELIARFEFNCDIEVLTAGRIVPGNRDEFVENNTTLLGEGEGVTAEEANEWGDEENKIPVPEAPVEPPAESDGETQTEMQKAKPAKAPIEFVSRPVVQPSS